MGGISGFFNVFLFFDTLLSLAFFLMPAELLLLLPLTHKFQYFVKFCFRASNMDCVTFFGGVAGGGGGGVEDDGEDAEDDDDADDDDSFFDN